MPNIGKFLIERLEGAGVSHAFGVPGDYVLSFYDQLFNSKIDLVTTTCERNAGIAADAYARINGIGVVVVTYCVGGFNIIDPIGCAFAEKSPVVVISGAPGIKERDEELLPHHIVREFECQHEIFSKITCANTVLRNTASAAYEIDRVLEACRYYKQPVYIEIPRDLVDKSISYDAWSVGTPPSLQSDEVSLSESLEESIQWINSAKKPVILAGVEVARYDLGHRLIKFAEKINTPIATTVLGKSVVNEYHPLSLGVFCGPLANDLCAKTIEESDCLIMMGVEMTDVSMGFLPRNVWRKNAILSTCTEMSVRSHSFRKVRFLDFFNKLSASSFTRCKWQNIGEKEVKKYVSDPNKKLTSQRLFEKVNSIIGEMAIVADVGDAMFGGSAITVNRNHFLSPAFYNSMGFAIPGGLGAHCANNNLRCLVLVGDGSFQMTSNELSTIIRRGFNPIVVVLNNGGFMTERFFKDGPYNDIGNWNYHNMGMVLGGGVGEQVTTEGELDLAFAKALLSKQVFIINAMLDKTDASPALKKVVGGTLASKMNK